MVYKWLKVQTHVHTINSDGKSTLREMAEGAAKNDIDIILLTDHNTMYGYKDADKIYKDTGVKIIKAIEYTTFYGHIITVGAPYYRWESLKENSLNELADHVHKNNGIIGIAHPRAIGNPVCTGGRYNFINTDFNKIDFVEEWHGVTDKYNEWEKNKDFWEDKADDGYKMTTVYGGDFHKKDDFEDSDAFNWIHAKQAGNLERAVMDAIKCGKVIMSKGPCFYMRIIKNDNVYTMGSVVKIRNKEKFNLIINVILPKNQESTIINLIDNFGRRIKIESNEKSIEMYAKENLKWIRAEICNKETNEVLAKCNPIYFTN